MTALVHDARARLAKIEAEVHAWHDECRRGFINFIGFRFLIGRALIEAKGIIPHQKPGRKGSTELVPNSGTNSDSDEPEGFLAWKRRAFPGIANQTLADYKGFAERVLDEHPDLARVDLLTLPDARREEVMAKLRAGIRGRDVTLSLRAMELIEDAAPAGGFRPNAKALRRWLEAAHPAHAATPWASLPKAIQREYRAALGDDLAERYDRRPPAEQLAARARAATVRWRPVLAFLERELGRAHDAAGKAVPAFWPHLPLAAQDGEPDLQTLHDTLGDLRAALAEHLRNRR